MSKDPAAGRDVSRNRQAFHLFEILDRFEAGIVLTGYEVKSARLGKVNLKDAFARIERGEIWLHHCHISPYENHTVEGLTPVDPLRKRKLLMHGAEIRRLIGKVEEKGLTLVALRMYFKGSRLKVELGLGRGKHSYDKRDTLRKKDQEREAPWPSRAGVSAAKKWEYPERGAPMRLTAILAFATLLAAAPAAADYRLILADGTAITVDTAPDVKGGTVSFSRGGLTYSLPLARVDLPATQSANGQAGGDSGKVQGTPEVGAPPRGSPAPPPRRFTDEDLPNRASHPSLPGQPVSPTAGGPAAPTGSPDSQLDGDTLSKWSELSREEKNLLSQRNSLGDRIRSLEDRLAALDAEDAKRRSDYANYPTDPSVLAAAQDWEEEYRRRSAAMEDEVADLQARKSDVDFKVRDVQLEMRDLSLAPEVGRVQ